MPVPGSTVSSVNRNKACPSPSFDARNLKNGEFNIVFNGSFYISIYVSIALKRCNLGYNFYKRLDGLSKLKSCKIIDSIRKYNIFTPNKGYWFGRSSIFDIYKFYICMIFLNLFYNFIFLYFKGRCLKVTQYKWVFCKIKKKRYPSSWRISERPGERTIL